MLVKATEVFSSQSNGKSENARRLKTEQVNKYINLIQCRVKLWECHLRISVGNGKGAPNVTTLHREWSKSENKMFRTGKELPKS